jgi:hypothetical protein
VTGLPPAFQVALITNVTGCGTASAAKYAKLSSFDSTVALSWLLSIAPLSALSSSLSGPGNPHFRSARDFFVIDVIKLIPDIDGPDRHARVKIW